VDNQRFAARVDAIFFRESGMEQVRVDLAAKYEPGFTWVDFAETIAMMAINFAEQTEAEDPEAMIGAIFNAANKIAQEEFGATMPMIAPM
jgi:hypothetical protein